MKIKPINKFLDLFLSKSVIAITLCPFGIYTRENPNLITINHEKIHWKQQVEMLVLPFYIWYLIEYLIRLFLNGSTAYNSLSFEREAYDNDKDMEYISKRKPYSWLKYIKKN